ncbi:hypothetical protein LC087_13410 [Bacillus carboniphilus]|uniref:Uncharacterized protein n=1 Tax=Bacillus carboniphilus TaxID=86663 RepID=A0ABY9JTK1_9BACI|nr:hypothetical protein [Bacillus carboniphilus]WLR41833.1 hypothetical protein LC087_13410 [Bacillus carboniphilus]
MGEPTGNAPNHFGEIKTFTLPNSQINYRVSSMAFTMLNGEDKDTITPDIPLSYSRQHIVNGVDPLMEWIEDHDIK